MVEINGTSIEDVSPLGVGELRRSARVNEVRLRVFDIFPVFSQVLESFPELGAKEFVGCCLWCCPGELGRVRSVALIAMPIRGGLVSRAARSLSFRGRAWLSGWFARWSRSYGRLRVGLTLTVLITPPARILFAIILSSETLLQTLTGLLPNPVCVVELYEIGVEGSICGCVVQSGLLGRHGGGKRPDGGCS